MVSPERLERSPSGLEPPVLPLHQGAVVMIGLEPIDRLNIVFKLHIPACGHHRITIVR